MTINEVKAKIESTIRQNGSGSITARKLKEILLGLADNIGEGGGSGSGGGYGLQGPAGMQGKTGAPGLSGEEGPRGKQGPMGTDGSDGLQGRQGRQGSNGNDGLDGYQGRQGRAGIDGIGTQGPMGSMGLQGPAGVGGSGGGSGSGTQGAVGAQGPKGDNGNNGSQGPVGVQGPAGSGSGSGSGSQGPQGPKGADGSQGPVGADYGDEIADLEGRVSALENGQGGGDNPAPSRDTSLEDRVTALEEQVEDMATNAMFTLKIYSASLSSGTYDYETFYHREGSASDGYEYTDETQFLVNINGGSRYYTGSLVATGGSEQIEFKPTVIFNNFEITEAFDGIYQKKVKKGETFNIKIFANGHEMYNQNFTVFNDSTQDIKMNFSNYVYLVVVPNKENAEINIYQGSTLKSNEVWTRIGGTGNIAWTNNATVFSYADGASMKQYSIKLSNYKKQVGWYNYNVRETSTQMSYGWHEYGSTDINSRSFTHLESTEIYENVIMPIDLNGESNVPKYNVTIGTPNPARAILSYNRGWHEALNEYKSCTAGQVLEAYNGEKFSVRWETAYVEGGPNYYPWGTSITVSGDTTITPVLAQETYRVLRFPPSNVEVTYSQIGFSNEAARNGEYGGGWGETPANGDGYFKSIYPDGYVTDFILRASGYVPNYKELLYIESEHNSIIDTTLTPISGPYLNVHVKRVDYNGSQKTADPDEYVCDGYQRIENASDGKNIWLYVPYTYNQYLGDMSRGTNASIHLAVFSSSQFEISAVHRSSDYGYTISTPSKSDGWQSRYDGQYYINDARIGFIVLCGVGSDGKVGDVTVTNEEGLSQVFHIYCKWYKGVA